MVAVILDCKIMHQGLIEWHMLGSDKRYLILSFWGLSTGTLEKGTQNHHPQSCFTDLHS